MLQRGGTPATTILCVITALGLALPGLAQDFRGTILGTVSDTTGGALPGASITISNLETNVASTVQTDAKGQFRVQYLNSGTYSVSAQVSGFKTVVKKPIQVRAGDSIALELTLATGGIEEVVEVTATTPLLDTSSGVTGQVIDSQQISQLPLGDGTAYMLTRLAPGVVDSSDLHFSRPADNGNLAGIKANGTQGANEFTIDGAPNTSNAQGVGFSPPSDAISEFKVQTNAFDAQAGHTAGAVVNLALKSGVNTLHFAGGYFNRDDSRSSTPLLTRRAGGAKPTRTYNRYTGTLSGPIKKDKTFFMLAYEHLRDVQPEPATYSVPTARMRQGDFSEFGAVQIFDPFTATSTGARSAFAGNLIPGSRVNPVAAAYAAFYPLPNLPGTQSNYFTNQLRPYDYNAYLGRIDHNFSSANKLFLTGYFNERREDRYNWAKDASNADAGKIGGFAVTQGFDFRSNLGGTLGFTSSLSNNLLLDIRASYARFGEYRDPAESFDPARLGFAANAVQLMNGYQYLPLFTFGSFSTTNSNSTIASLGSQRSDWGEGFDRPFKTFSFAPTLTRIWGAHTAKAGYDLRYQRWNIVSSGYPGGRFQFNGAYTRANNSAATNDRAQSWAQFLLGLPTATTGNVATPGTSSSQFEIASPGEFSQAFHAVFLQDDWRVSRKLTLNLGLRFEVNTGMKEAENRNLAGFDTSSASPIEAAAAAAYARNPIAEIAPGNLRVKGGLLYANGPTYASLSKPLPRGAFSYLINDKTVVRGGVGLFSYDYFFDTINQQGFSQATPVLVTQDNGITFTGANLTNPVPSGQLIQPPGSSLGLGSSLGQNLTGGSPGAGGALTSNNLVQPERGTPYYRRWQIGAQRDLGGNWKVEVLYVSSRGKNLPVFRQANSIPIQYLSRSRSRDTALEATLSQQVASPFTGLLPGSTINGATVQRQQLLRPYPQFGTFGIETNKGSDRYDAGSIAVEKRFRNGNSFTVQYTRSSLRDKRNYPNPAEDALEDRVSPDDRPNRASVGASLELPFGRGHKWGGEWNGILQALLGGWQVSGTYQYQTGFPIVFASLYYDANRDPRELASNIGKKIGGKIAGLDVPAWDTSGFYFHDATVQTGGSDDAAKQRADQRIQLGNNYRYFPSTLPDVRNHDLNLMDLGLYKNFSLPRDIRLQVRFEALNALNYAVLFSPDANPRNTTFGYTTTDRNSPRDLQIAVRLTF